MDYVDAQIEIALLRSIERQADRTAAALERVIRLSDKLRRRRRQLPTTNKPTTNKPTTNCHE